MQVLSARVDFDAFLERIAKATARVLMLDYDGTLAPFHIRPECAVPYPGVAEVLREIAAAGGTRVVIVSGRPVDEIPPLLELPQLPEIWGSHGWERLLPDGRRIVGQPSAEARHALTRAAEAIREFMPRDSRLERKIASLALHWRGVSMDIGESLRLKARELWGPVAREAALEMLPFDGGIELRVKGYNKEYPVKTVLSETPADAAVAYLGDDMTDEDAFRAVKERGLAVLVRPELRASEADVWLRPPDELLTFMRYWRIIR